MTAGLNLLGNLWQYSNPPSSDDDIGGAVPTGTVSYYGMNLRLQTLKPTQALLEQGYESKGLFTALIEPHTVPIQFNGEIEITAPSNSPHLGNHFRIIGEPQRTSMSPSDSRGYLIVHVQRIEKGRTIQ